MNGSYFKVYSMDVTHIHGGDVTKTMSEIDLNLDQTQPTKLQNDTDEEHAMAGETLEENGHTGIDIVPPFVDKVAETEYENVKKVNKALVDKHNTTESNNNNGVNENSDVYNSSNTTFGFRESAKTQPIAIRPKTRDLITQHNNGTNTSEIAMVGSNGTTKLHVDVNISKASKDNEESHDINEIEVTEALEKRTITPLDLVDGNWISRDPFQYDSIDAQDIDDSGLGHKPKTCCGRVKYVLGIFKATIVPLVTIIIFAYDKGGDIELAMEYRSTDELTYFWVTVGCIVLPAVLMSIVDIFWIIMERDRRCNKFKWHDVCRIIMGGLSLGPIVRACICAAHTIQAIRNPHQHKYTGKADEKRRDEAMLNFILAFTEDMVMLTVQLYLYLTGRVELAISVHSLVGSIIGIAWTYSCLYRDGRKARQKSNNLRVFGFIFFLLAAISVIASREVGIVFFVIYTQNWAWSIVLTVHFVAMYFWLWRQQRDEGGTKTCTCAKSLYLTFFAYVSVFIFISVKSGKSFRRMIIFYVILYIETFIMAGVAFSKIQQSDNSNSDVVYYLIAVPAGFVFHVIFTSIYYSCFHANHRMCCKFDIDV